MTHALSGLDAALLYLETPSAPLVVAQVCVFDPSSSPEGYSFDRVRSLLEARLHRLPPFRQRLIEPPLGLGHPLWIEDPEFDLDNHVQPATLPAPGGIDELAAFTEAFVAEPLHRRRPLWEMQIVDGLEDGLVAAVTKIHHAAIDGVSGTELTANLLDLEPTPTPDPPAPAWTPDPAPSPVELLRRAAASVLAQPRAAIDAAGAVVGAARRVRELNRETEGAPPPAPYSAPDTPFNATVRGRRHIELAHLDLPDLMVVKEASGATINEVVLALCAGALRSYLDDLGALPDRDLVAAVPISVRTEELRGAMGNRLSVMLVGLATTIEDPCARLVASIERSRRAKEQDRAIGPDTLSRLAAAIPPGIGPRLGPLAESLQLLRRPRPSANVLISNFPGPPFPLYCAGARLVAAYPIGPILSGAALNITLQSYLDALHVGIVTDPDVVPYAEHLPGLLREALDELVKIYS